MVSDVHFGNAGMSQTEMGDAFMETLFPLLKDTDIFFINGDLFDDLVSFDHPGFDPIYETILMVFHMCEKHQIKLRVLQGTWSHDRNQCKRLIPFYKSNHFTFDFKVIDAIELEEIFVKDRSLRFFYTPDDLPFKQSDEIVDVIKNKLTEKGWDYVDYGCMHGFFDFTFPQKISQENRVVFKESQFPFVRKAIDVGHVHQHRISGRVISNGSFDRLCHGEEEAKGCVLFQDFPENYTVSFIENVNPAIYKTLYIPTEADTEQIVGIITEQLSKFTSSRKISLRFVVDDSGKWQAIKTWMRENHPDVRITTKKTNDKSDSVGMILSTTSFSSQREKKVVPTRKTLSTFIRSRIPEEYVLPIEDIEMYLGIEP